MIHRIILVFAAAAVSTLPFGSARAQQASPNPPSDRRCEPNEYENGLATYAETRDQRLAQASTDEIDPGQNGSIIVHAWQQSDVLVRACIQSAAPSDSGARALASQVKIAEGPGRIEPSGPSEDHRHRWDVSYEVWVPNASDLDLRAHNGSIGVDSVHGRIRFDTTNGSVRLEKLGGDVEGSTTNGSLNIGLAGSHWDGAGLRAETTNGSVHVYVPDGYSAKFEASTVNGRVNVDFPITVSGEIGKSLSFQLGSGGPTIAARTTNGSIHIGRA
jgi:Putative adhesin